MSNLLIDIGNTNFKWLFRAGPQSLRGVGSSGAALDDAIRELAASLGYVGRIGVACVKSVAHQQAVVAALSNHFGMVPYVASVSAQACGVVNSYAEPERMGVDRWLAMIAARARAPGAFCVVDCGSAVTLDWVSEEGRHLGGYIVAGLRLAITSLLAGTDQVIVDSDKLFDGQPTPGQNTTDAVYNGAVFSLVAQVDSAYQWLRHSCNGGGAQLVLTGGDARLVSRHLRCPHAIVDDLVFDGLETLMTTAGGS